MARLKGENLVLKEFSKEDIPNIREWVNDYEVTKFLSDIFLYPHTLTETESFVNYVLEGKDNSHKEFIIAKKDSLDYVGQVNLFNIDWKNRSAEMGIVIGKKDSLGKGIGREAIELLQYFVFNKLNFNRLELKVLDFNERAINCYKKCGFVEDGRLRKRFYVDGKYTDYVIMSILKEEYDNRDCKTREFIFNDLGIAR